ncbi:MAG: hypothetical protein IKI97_02800 [Clostridia bacterium]|nr:hypothetical protein [Clostridia bacterium]
MQKTKLGISVGVFGALLYAFGYFGGYLLTALLVGYVLFKEENLWLRRTAVKVVVLMIGFSLLSIVMGLLPEIISIVSNALNIVGVELSNSVFDNIWSILLTIIGLAEKAIFIVLGIMAFSQKTIRIPGIDNIVDKSIG